MIYLNIIYFIISALFLIGSATFLVRSLEKISKFLRISEFTAAFIIMAIATSIPELFVGISSAIAGNPSLSLGNVIGASIIDLTLIIGILTLIGRGIKIKTEKIGKDIYYVLGAIGLLIVLFLIGNSLSRIDGIILLGFFGFNMVRMLKKKRRYSVKVEKNGIKRKEAISTTIVFMLSLAILFFASKYAVKYASAIALDLQLPQIIIGLFLLSIATTLPELIFGIRAIKLGHKEMAIGDQTGTVLANIALILGIVAIINPITASIMPFLISAIFLFIVSFIFITFIKSENKLNIWEGVSLILIYIFFIIIEFFVKP